MLLGQDLAQKKSDIKRIFFYRICGTGMGACACLAREAGFEVAGADMTYSPPMSTYLESQNIDLYKLDEVTQEMLAEYDLIIVGNSVPRLSDYARFIENSGVPFTSFPAFMGEFLLKDREVVGIAGTHGKTTTTYFISQILESLGEDVGYFIGGIIDGRAPSHLGQSKYFVIESDEYDSAYFQKISKFRLYELTHMILTSLEYDHADIFDSIEDIKNEFSAILPDLTGHIIANDAYPAIAELKNDFNSKDWTLYGEKSKVGPLNIKVADGQTHFQLNWKNEDVDFTTNVIGTHNILNISSCLIFLLHEGYSINSLQEAVKNLGMVKRRQEYRGKYKEAIVIDDFAHHPKAITLTISAIRAKYPERKIVTIFEPISATARSSIFQNEFTSSLALSDEVVLAMNPLQTTVKSGQNLDGDKIKKELSSQNIPTYKAQDLGELMQIINESAAPDKLLLVLSNRTCLGLWESKFVQDLA
tara:strand:- start:7026 stop:8447 length:1422 start_codon:yes stop_codon:yes gene_type:complete